MTGSRSDTPGVGVLLREAAQQYDASDALRTAAKQAATRGFQGGAEWMGLALSELRGAPGVALPAGATRAGLLKYGAATAAGAAVLALLAPHSLAAAAPLAILAFYVVEGFGAFVFPALAAGIPSPFHESLASVKSSGGIAAVVPRILVIASVMLFGGFAGRGFLRSWCIGCLAMVLWHRAVRG